MHRVVARCGVPTNASRSAAPMLNGAPMPPKCMGKGCRAAGATSKSEGSRGPRGCGGGTYGSSMTEPFMRSPQGGPSAKGSSLNSPSVPADGSGGSDPRGGCVLAGSAGCKPGLVMRAIWGASAGDQAGGLRGLRLRAARGVLSRVDNWPWGSGPGGGCVLTGSNGSKPGLMMHAIWGGGAGGRVCPGGGLLAAPLAACGCRGSGRHGGHGHWWQPAHLESREDSPAPRSHVKEARVAEGRAEKTAVHLLGKQCCPAPRRLLRQPLRSPTLLGPRMPQCWLLMPRTGGETTPASSGSPLAAARAAARGWETSSPAAHGAYFLQLMPLLA